jgi:hypothetical protein
VRWGDGRLLADVAVGKTAVWVVLLGLTTFGVGPLTTSLLVLDGSTPSSSSTETDAGQDAPDPESSSTKGTTCTGPTDAE